jgi:hypothetical protein
MAGRIPDRPLELESSLAVDFHAFDLDGLGKADFFLPELEFEFLAGRQIGDREMTVLVADDGIRIAANDDPTAQPGMDAATDFDRLIFFLRQARFDGHAGRNQGVGGGVLRGIELAVVADRIGVFDLQLVAGAHQHDMGLEPAIFVIEHHFAVGLSLVLRIDGDLGRADPNGHVGQSAAGADFDRLVE